MPEEQANEWLWRIFRLYMAELSEPQLDGVLQQLENEIAARRQCDNDAARLLFSTLSASDLEIARQQIINAQQIEAEARQIQAAPAEAKALPRAAGAHASPGRIRQPPPAVSPHNSGPPAHNSLACESGQSDECDDRGRSRSPKENRNDMTTFTITEDNNVTAFASAGEAAQPDAINALTFDSPASLAGIAAEWPMSRLVEIYNSIPGHGEVKRFADRNKAVARIWDALQPLGRNVAAIEVAQDDRNATEPAEAAAKAPARRKPPNREASPKANKASNTGSRRTGNLRHAGRGSATDVRGGSKKAAVIAMMKRPRGATLADIMAVTGWQAHYADVQIMPTCVGNLACGR
jgi:hypothetical protein